MPRFLGTIAALLPLLGLTAASRADEPAPAPVRLPYARYLDRLQGGWAGQMIGVSYGSVYEFRALGHTIDGPIRDWKPEFIDNTIQQDDLYVEMTFLKVLQDRGIDPSFREVGEAFRDSKYDLWHANHAGRVNLRAGIMPPESGHPRYNPHSDDIDFQIESDLFGLIAPGLYGASARLCDRFGAIMNYGDGLYGGRFTAAMYARAYLEDGPSPEAIVRCVEAGLDAIPESSRYAQLVRDILAAYRRDPGDWKAAWNLVETRWAREDLCPEGEGKPFNIDAKVNGGYVVIGLLYGQGDFERTCEIATRCGQDADCNPSSAAGVLGTLTGYEAIPSTYRQGIPALTGRKFSYTDYDFPTLIATCQEVTKRLLESEGGRIVDEGGEKVLEIPARSPQPPAKVEDLRTFSKADLATWRAEFEKRAHKSKDR